MNYINDATKEIKSYYTLKSDNAGTASLPVDGTQIILADWWLIHATERPAYDADTQKLEAGTPVKDTVYYEAWNIVQLNQEELNAVLSREQSNKKYSIATDVLAELDAFYKSADLTQARVRDQITSKYNVYSRIEPDPTPEQIEYMAEVDNITEYTAILFDSLEVANAEIMALTDPDAVRAYIYTMPDNPNPLTVEGELDNTITSMSAV